MSTRKQFIVTVKPKIRVRDVFHTYAVLVEAKSKKAALEEAIASCSMSGESIAFRGLDADYTKPVVHDNVPNRVIAI